MVYYYFTWCIWILIRLIIFEFFFSLCLPTVLNWFSRVLSDIQTHNVGKSLNHNLLKSKKQKMKATIYILSKIKLVKLILDIIFCFWKHHKQINFALPKINIRQESFNHWWTGVIVFKKQNWSVLAIQENFKTIYVLIKR